MQACRTIRRYLTVALVAVVLSVAPTAVDACPTCKDAIAQNDPHHQQMVKGYFYSILFMMSMPFIVLGTFGGMAYLSIKRARQNSAGEVDLSANQANGRESSDSR